MSDIIGHIRRTQIDIPEDHLEALNAMAMAKEVSLAELLRQAISKFLRTHAATKTGDEITRSAGAWGEDFEDGLAYQLRLRAEWDDR